MQNNIPTISVDFDGVILQLVMGRLWRRQPLKQKNPALASLVAPFEFIWSFLSLLFRRAIPLSHSSLSKLKSTHFQLYLLTSRTSNDFPACRFWLARHGYKAIFNQYFHNAHHLLSQQFKLNIIKSQGVDIHIDDDPITLEFLAQSLPNVKFVHFRYYHQPTPNYPNIVAYDSWPQVVNYLSQFQSPLDSDLTPTPPAE